MTDKKEAAQTAAEAEAAEAGNSGIVSPGQGGSPVPAEQEPSGEAAPSGEEVPEELEEEPDPYPLATITPEMVQGGDWSEYRPSLTFRAKTMPEGFSVETKDGLVTGEPGDVVAVVGDDLHVFSASVFAAEYQPVVHGA